MANYTADSKSQLAKLMATENITVQHQVISTAYFDVKNRTLVCPIWKDMSSELYDLLMGHEVGHALDTPSEGWHNAVVENNKGRGYKGFLNVVEDARIEKRQKRRYPGLRRSFLKGYQDLLDRDFFGIKNKDVNDLPFIDRLNLYTKGGVMLGIEFTDAEKVMVSKVEACETWEDVVRVTDEIYEYSKDEQQMIEQEFFDDDSESDEFEFVEEDMDGEEGDGESSEGDGEESDSKSTKSSNDSEKESGTEDKDDEKKQEAKTLNREKESSVQKEQDDFEPICETDETFRQREAELLDKRSKPYMYLDLPKANLKKIVTPVSRVQEMLTEFYNANIDAATRKRAVQTYKSKHERYIALLAKEFEMRKAAKAYAKKKVSETGDIDVSKIYKYRIDDNVFRKMTTVPNGKSHGMVLLLDRSGSMSNNMAGSIDQILILSMFCRRVSIPFVVYGFGNNYGGRTLDFPNEGYADDTFEHKVNGLSLDSVYLREYLNSKMSTKDFNQAICNLVLLRNAYAGKYRQSYLVPPQESLSNTPLNEALVAMKPILEDFRKVHNVDIMNLIIVQDGDADKVTCYHDENLARKYFNIMFNNIVVRDEKSKYQIELEHNETYIGEQFRNGLLNWLKHTTGVRTFGFFICDNNLSGIKNSIINRYVDKDGKYLYEGLSYDEKYRLKYSPKVEELVKELKEQKFLSSNTPGYNSFYIIPGGNDLSVGAEEIEVDDNATISKIKTAFQKHNKKRQLNRVLVNRFISNIAA